MLKIGIRLLFLLLTISGTIEAVCRDTETCIERIKKIVTEPRKFWFAEQHCLNRHAKSFECGGPKQLENFHSIGTRLFRVKTYHSAYLNNLAIFPRVTYRASPGHYEACEHQFFSGNTSAVEVDPDMEPVDPFRIRKRPEISWSDLHFDDQYTIVFTDVGYGTLNYLAVDFPKNTKVLKEYEPTANFRSSPNPIAVIIFRNNGREIEKPKSDEDFDLNSFMLENQLADDLVGLSIIISGSDPFAIGKQKLSGKLDYCHSLLLTKFSHPSSRQNVLQKLPLEEIDSWITVSYEQEHLSANVCCQKVKLPRKRVTLDPLGDLSISALATKLPPTVLSLRMTSNQESNGNYHRQTRNNYVGWSNLLFSLAIVDENHGHLHYLQVDIPAVNLNIEKIGGITKAEYLALIPKKPSSCNSYVFLLFSHSHPMKSLPEFCSSWCDQRRQFKPDLFKQQNNLRLSAFSTVSSCYDLPYAYNVLMHDLKQNRSQEQIGYKRGENVDFFSTVN
ncbi:unnamed protein product [Caenorhabditis angaria]|uniref:Uncharacterized protein n=1 Tax=Caenorhabditis angaria TaxID=860376 RepID=A0A9P1IL53_9PELO|nr:unnamed protein product [Caenorhabditis angaria]